MAFINNLLTNGSSIDQIDDYEVGKSLSQARPSASPLELQLDQSGLKYAERSQIGDVDYEQKPKEEMPDCCQIHQDAFKMNLDVEDLKITEIKMPLILASLREDVEALYEAISENLQNTIEIAEDIVYDISDKVSSLYESLEEIFEPKETYSSLATYSSLE